MPPIGKVVRLWLEGGKLKATATFSNQPFAQRVRELVDDRILQAVSVGFMPINWTFNHKRDGIDFEQQDLLELSIVPVPANPESLIEASACKAMTERDLTRLGFGLAP